MYEESANRIEYLREKLNKLEKEITHYKTSQVQWRILRSTIEEDTKELDCLVNLEWITSTNPEKMAVLRNRINRATSQLTADKNTLIALESKCLHKWTEPRRLSDKTYDMESNIYWLRSCSVCGKEERTTNSKNRTVEVPIFPT